MLKPITTSVSHLIKIIFYVLRFIHNPVNNTSLINADLMLGYCLRRFPNIKSALSYRVHCRLLQRRVIPYSSTLGATWFNLRAVKDSFNCSVTWSCVSLPRFTSPSDWKLLELMNFRPHCIALAHYSRHTNVKKWQTQVKNTKHKMYFNWHWCSRG